MRDCSHGSRGDGIAGHLQELRPVPGRRRLPAANSPARRSAAPPRVNPRRTLRPPTRSAARHWAPRPARSSARSRARPVPEPRSARAPDCCSAARRAATSPVRRRTRCSIAMTPRTCNACTRTGTRFRVASRIRAGRRGTRRAIPRRITRLRATQGLPRAVIRRRRRREAIRLRTTRRRRARRATADQLIVAASRPHRVRLRSADRLALHRLRTGLHTRACVTVACRRLFARTASRRAFAAP